jgi:hypothetical protein
MLQMIRERADDAAARRLAEDEEARKKAVAEKEAALARAQEVEDEAKREIARKQASATAMVEEMEAAAMSKAKAIEEKAIRRVAEIEEQGRQRAEEAEAQVQKEIERRMQVQDEEEVDRSKRREAQENEEARRFEREAKRKAKAVEEEARLKLDEALKEEKEAKKKTDRAEREARRARKALKAEMAAQQEAAATALQEKMEEEERAHGKRLEAMTEKEKHLAKQERALSKQAMKVRLATMEAKKEAEKENRRMEGKAKMLASKAERRSKKQAEQHAQQMEQALQQQAQGKEQQEEARGRAEQQQRTLRAKQAQQQRLRQRQQEDLQRAADAQLHNQALSRLVQSVKKGEPAVDDVRSALLLLEKTFASANPAAASGPGVKASAPSVAEGEVRRAFQWCAEEGSLAVMKALLAGAGLGGRAQAGGGGTFRGHPSARGPSPNAGLVGGMESSRKGGKGMGGGGSFRERGGKGGGKGLSLDVDAIEQEMGYDHPASARPPLGGSSSMPGVLSSRGKGGKGEGKGTARGKGKGESWGGPSPMHGGKGPGMMSARGGGKKPPLPGQKPPTPHGLGSSGGFSDTGKGGSGPPLTPKFYGMTQTARGANSARGMFAGKGGKGKGKGGKGKGGGSMTARPAHTPSMKGGGKGKGGMMSARAGPGGADISTDPAARSKALAALMSMGEPPASARGPPTEFTARAGKGGGFTARGGKGTARGAMSSRGGKGGMPITNYLPRGRALANGLAVMPRVTARPDVTQAILPVALRPLFQKLLVTAASHGHALSIEQILRDFTKFFPPAGRESAQGKGGGNTNARPPTPLEISGGMRGTSPLFNHAMMVCTQGGHLPVAKRLLAPSAPCRLSAGTLSQCLHTATERANPDMVRELLPHVQLMAALQRALRANLQQLHVLKPTTGHLSPHTRPPTSPSGGAYAYEDAAESEEWGAMSGRLTSRQQRALGLHHLMGGKGGKGGKGVSPGAGKGGGGKGGGSAYDYQPVSSHEVLGRVHEVQKMLVDSIANQVGMAEAQRIRSELLAAAATAVAGGAIGNFPTGNVGKGGGSGPASSRFQLDSGATHTTASSSGMGGDISSDDDDTEWRVADAPLGGQKPIALVMSPTANSGRFSSARSMVHTDSDED